MHKWVRLLLFDLPIDFMQLKFDCLKKFEIRILRNIVIPFVFPKPIAVAIP